jgi:MFS superfamily sulfate permease-like transporter
VLVGGPDGRLRPADVSTHGYAAPGLVIYRFSHSLYYANAAKFQNEVLELTRPGGPPVSWLCVDATAIDDVDYTAGVMLQDVATTLRERKVQLVFASVSDLVRGELDRSGVTSVIGNDAYLSDMDELMRRYSAR